jgi:hypothetical protein
MAPRAASKKRKLEDSSVQERRGRAKESGAKRKRHEAAAGAWRQQRSSRPLKAFPLTVLVAAFSCSAVGAKPETDDAVQRNDLAAHRCVPD